jgi:hypothetical protein
MNLMQLNLRLLLQKSRLFSFSKHEKCVERPAGISLSFHRIVNNLTIKNALFTIISVPKRVKATIEIAVGTSTIEKTELVF